MRLKLTHIFIFILLISGSVSAQRGGFDRWSERANPALNAGLSWAQPVGMFAEVDTAQLNYFGIGGDISVPVFHGSPFRLGVGFRYFWMGERNDLSYFNDDNGDQVELNSRVRGSMMPIHVHARFDLGHYTDFPIMPYAGAFAGMRLFNVNHQLVYDYNDGSDPYTDNNWNLSATSSYGYELGVHVRLNDHFLLDARWERAYGGWAKYLDVSSVIFSPDGTPAYDRHSSRTDVEVITVGVSMIF